MTDLELFGLEDNPKLSTLRFDNEKDWLELRTKGIGGSDIGAIMGLNKYTSPLQIYKQKVEGYVKDLSDNVNVKKGKDLEDFILVNYVKPHFLKQGYIVHKPDFMIINSDMDFIRANVDGIGCSVVKKASANNIIIEIKYVSEHAEVNWNGDEYCGVPASYYAQVQLYLAVTGAKEGYVCALFDSNWEVKYYRIPRDEMFILKLIGAARKFYNIHMMTKIPPLVTASLDKEEAVEAVKSAPTPTTPSPEMSDLIRKYKEVNAKIKELEKFKNKASDALFKYYQTGHYPDDNTLSFKVSTVTTSRFNSTKFKTAHPEMYDEYVEESSYTKTTVK